MKAARATLALLFAAAVALPAQTPASDSATKAPAPKRTKAGKPVLPDPDLLDGSIYEPEKRPLYVMQSEIEMGEQEAGKSDKVSPQSGPAGQGEQQDQQGGSAGDPDKKRAQPGGAETKPEGIKVENLKIPEGAAGQQDANTPPPNKPRDIQIGDATLQIQTVPQSAQKDIVGQNSSTAQQAAKNIPQGQQTDNRNKGSEKGKVVPKGL